MKITKTNAILLFVELGFSNATNWDAAKLATKINQIADKIDAEQEMKTPAGTKLLKQVFGALEEGTKIEVTEDEASAAAPAKKGKAKAAPVEADDADDTDEEEAPKPAKKGKGKAAAAPVAEEEEEAPKPAAKKGKKAPVEAEADEEDDSEEPAAKPAKKAAKKDKGEASSGVPAEELARLEKVALKVAKKGKPFGIETVHASAGDETSRSHVRRALRIFAKKGLISKTGRGEYAPAASVE